MDAVDFINKPLTGEPQPLYVLHGDEDFLKRQAREVLIPWLLQDADPAFALAVYAGETAIWSTIRGELDTLPFLSPRRVVLIEQADPFISEFRENLEKYLKNPSKGVLIFDVRTWASTTKLAKATPDSATIICKAPKSAQLPNWCIQRAKKSYGKKLADAAAQMLVELTEPSLGLLDQELAKLATYVGDANDISLSDVDHLVGSSRAAETFKIFDAIGNGKTAEALGILQRLIADGNDPIAILGAFSWQLRRLAQASRLIRRGMPTASALAQVGVRDFAMRNWEQLLKHLGRHRLEKLYDWLLEVDLGLKGNNPLPMPLQLERLVVKLATSAIATASKAR